MKRILLISLSVFICHFNIHSQAIYVDSELGNDDNKGTKDSPLYSIPKAMEIIQSNDNEIYTIKINPGIYVLETFVAVQTEKEMSDKRIVIEASILPDDSLWTPEKMTDLPTALLSEHIRLPSGPHGRIKSLYLNITSSQVASTSG